MSIPSTAPLSIMLEFLAASGEPLRLIDLDAQFLSSNGIVAPHPYVPFRVAIERKTSKAGNAFYEYSQNSVPLPDGLATYLKLEGAIVPMGKTRPSNSGYPTREGSAQIVVGGVIYLVTAYVTESRSPYYVKVVAHKLPDKAANIAKAQRAPRGGTIISYFPRRVADPVKRKPFGRTGERSRSVEPPLIAR